MSTIGKDKYKTQNYTVTIERHQDCNTDSALKNFKWVRIYANVSTIEYLGSSKLLLSCVSGSKSSRTLLKEARVLAKQKLDDYNKKAKAILALPSPNISNNEQRNEQYQRV
jgi:hypothetical protein